MRRGYPTAWLMTDERIPDLRGALLRLPPGSGIVFRHHATPPAARRALFAQVRRIARARRLTLVVAGASLPGADGVHGRGPTKGLRTWPAHDRAEALAGVRAGADLLFVSPVYTTRSHPGAPVLGARRARRIGTRLRLPLIALGGMTQARWRRLKGFHGWAAIDAWTSGPPRSP